MDISTQFIESIRRHAGDDRAGPLWAELEKKYSGRLRHYHTLAHLNSLLAELSPLHEHFSNWDAVVFAIAYHDAIYNTLKNDNEERSAMLAVKRLEQTSFPPPLIERCRQLVLATKKHECGDVDTNLFTDADLAILGSPPEVYAEYAQDIRREYVIYPDLVYKPGRKKVLAHFLGMDRIFKTDHFHNRYESNAKTNLQKELSSL